MKKISTVFIFSVILLLLCEQVFAKVPGFYEVLKELITFNYANISIAKLITWPLLFLFGLASLFYAVDLFIEKAIINRIFHAIIEAVFISMSIYAIASLARSALPSLFDLYGVEVFCMVWLISIYDECIYESFIKKKIPLFVPGSLGFLQAEKNRIQQVVSKFEEKLNKEKDYWEIWNLFNIVDSQKKALIRLEEDIKNAREKQSLMKTSFLIFIVLYCIISIPVYIFTI